MRWSLLVYSKKTLRDPSKSGSNSNCLFGSISTSSCFRLAALFRHRWLQNFYSKSTIYFAVCSTGCQYCSLWTLRSLHLLLAVEFPRIPGYFPWMKRPESGRFRLALDSLSRMLPRPMQTGPFDPKLSYFVRIVKKWKSFVVSCSIGTILRFQNW